jgi:hypothetical protein
LFVSCSFFQKITKPRTEEAKRRNEERNFSSRIDAILLKPGSMLILCIFTFWFTCLQLTATANGALGLGSPGGLSSEDESFSRQLLVYGRGAQSKLRDAHVVVLGSG